MAGTERKPSAVFPTRVGMNRSIWNAAKTEARIPHTRGDEPMAESSSPLDMLYSPHAWG